MRYNIFLHNKFLSHTTDKEQADMLKGIGYIVKPVTKAEEACKAALQSNMRTHLGRLGAPVI